jgi:hypothetical protein
LDLGALDAGNLGGVALIIKDLDLMSSVETFSDRQAHFWIHHCVDRVPSEKL